MMAVLGLHAWVWRFAMATKTDIPEQMRAAAMDDYGPPRVVHTETLPVPKLGRDDILVRVSIAGVGTWDPDLVDGTVKDVDTRFPRVLGSDGVGIVVAVGAGVDRFAVGDRVYGWGFGNRKGGFFAEYAAIPESKLAHVPASISFEQAGALAVAGVTALQGLEQLQLDDGAHIVIFGASGGLGHVAIQLAKRLGLRVFAVASHDDGVDLATQLGADRVADGHGKKLLHELRDAAPDGFAGALVFAGGNGWGKELELVADGGPVAWPQGVEPVPDVPDGVHAHAYDGEPSRAVFARLNELVSRRPFHIELSRIYSLDAVADAIRDVKHHHIGKLAIEVSTLPPA
jgi:NADPH:quinone reductase-like Zn-dependent oxidoreductase